jgi:hypothetical protein
MLLLPNDEINITSQSFICGAHIAQLNLQMHGVISCSACKYGVCARIIFEPYWKEVFIHVSILFREYRIKYTKTENAIYAS